MEMNNSENKLFGSVDAKIVNTEMAKKMRFYGRYGSACGRVFKKTTNLQDEDEELIPEFPSTKWIVIEN